MRRIIKRLISREEGAVTVDWVVLSAAVVGLLGVGYGMMRTAATDLADTTEAYMGSTGPDDF